MSGGGIDLHVLLVQLDLRLDLDALGLAIEAGSKASAFALGLMALVLAIAMVSLDRVPACSCRTAAAGSRGTRRRCPRRPLRAWEKRGKCRVRPEVIAQWATAKTAVLGRRGADGAGLRATR